MGGEDEENNFSPELSCKEGTVWETDADSQPTENPAQYEAGKVWRGGDDDPAQSCRNTGGQYCPLRSKPPSTVSAKEATNNLANVDTAG